MFMSLLSPFMPWILGGVAALALAAFLYVKRLRSKNAQLQTQLTMVKHANDANVKTITDLHAQNTEYRNKIELAMKADAAAVATKTAAVEAAKAIKGDDTDTITQADLDKLKKPKGVK